MKRIVIGVMGPGPSATDVDLKNALQLGRLIAGKGWVLLTGGMNLGVMDSASRGAREEGGLVVGVLPSADDGGASDAVDIAIVTGMGSARNNINVLSSHVVIACGMGPGTASEVALAVKAGKKVVLLNDMEESKIFFLKLSPHEVIIAENPDHAVSIVEGLLA